MPTAPRYQPGGVNVGSMPTPQVRPQTGMAEGVAAAGDTIASLGKSYQYAKDAQERRAQIEDASNETAGEMAFQKWNQAQKARYDRFQTDAQGEKIGKARDDFVSGLSGDTGEFTKDLSPQAVDAFEKRRSFQAQTYSDSSGNIAHARSGAFIDGVARLESTQALSQAAGFAASGDIANFDASIGRGWAAKVRSATVTGEPVDAAAFSDYRAIGVTSALEAVKHNGSDEQTVTFFEQHKGEFGKHLGTAQTLAQDSLDNLEAASSVSIVVDEKRQPNGLVDWAGAADRVAGYENIRPEVQAKIQKALSLGAAAEAKNRTALGDKIAADYAAAQMRSPGDAAAYEKAHALEISALLDKDAAAFQERKILGPAKSNPGQWQTIRAMQYADPDAFYALKASNWALSVSDAQWLNDEQRKPRDPERDSVSKWSRQTYEANGLRKVPKAEAGKELTGKELAQYTSVEQMVDKVHSQIKADKKTYPDGINEKNVKLATSLYLTEQEKWTSGFLKSSITEQFSGEMAIPADTPSSIKKLAGIKDSDSGGVQVAKLAAFQKTQADIQEETDRAAAASGARAGAAAVATPAFQAPGDAQILGWYRSLGVR